MIFRVFGIGTQEDRFTITLRRFARDHSLELILSILPDGTQRYNLLREKELVIELDVVPVSDTQLQIQVALRCKAGAVDCAELFEWAEESYNKDLSDWIKQANRAPYRFAFAESCLQARQARRNAIFHIVKQRRRQNNSNSANGCFPKHAWRKRSQHPRADYFQRAMKQQAQRARRQHAVAEILQGLSPVTETQTTQPPQKELFLVPANQANEVSLPRQRRRGGPKPITMEEKRGFVEGWLAVQDSITQEMYCRDNAISPSALRRWMRELHVD